MAIIPPAPLLQILWLLIITFHMRHHNYEEYFYSGSSHNKIDYFGEYDSKCNTLPYYL